MRTVPPGATTRRLCSTTALAVIKLSTMSLAFALTFSSAACQKAPDLAKMQEETIGAVKIYITELNILQRRADLLEKNIGTHGSAQGAEEAKQILAEAKKELDQMHRLAGSTPTLAATAAKSNNPEEISKVHDETIAKLDEGIANVKDELAASDTWLGVAENSHGTTEDTVAKAPSGGTESAPTAAGQAPATPPGPPTPTNPTTKPTGTTPVPAPAAGASVASPPTH